jgi:hypothetical protein
MSSSSMARSSLASERKSTRTGLARDSRSIWDRHGQELAFLRVAEAACTLTPYAIGNAVSSSSLKRALSNPLMLSWLFERP